MVVSLMILMGLPGCGEEGQSQLLEVVEDIRMDNQIEENSRVNDGERSSRGDSWAGDTGTVRVTACSPTDFIPECKGLGLCALGGEAVCSPMGIWGCQYPDALPLEAAESLCDGLDNDCDGETDEHLGTGAACDTGLLFPCDQGVLTCVAEVGGMVCVGVESLQEELCDGLDNDCDGLVDEEFPEKFSPCDANDDGCYTGEWRCESQTELGCFGDMECEQLNPMCVLAMKPDAPDHCGCAADEICDPVKSNVCMNGNCQCGYLGSSCMEGYACDFGSCVGSDSN